MLVGKAFSLELLFEMSSLEDFEFPLDLIVSLLVE